MNRIRGVRKQEDLVLDLEQLRVRFRITGAQGAGQISQYSQGNLIKFKQKYGHIVKKAERTNKLI